MVKNRGGYYFRYSDDILIIVPGGVDLGKETMDYVRELITTFGSKLVIKEEKSSIVQFKKITTIKLLNGFTGNKDIMV